MASGTQMSLFFLLGFPGTSVIAFWHTLFYSCVILLPAFSLCSPDFLPVGHLASHALAGSLSHPPLRGFRGEAFTEELRVADPSVLGGATSSSCPSQEL